MATSRRLGDESSKTRALLIDATAEIMQDEGYPAVSARRVAERAGLKPQLVHYYFRTMDDLFVAVFRQASDQHRDRLNAALASPTPLKALWALFSDRTGTRLTMEFTALANHRQAMRDEVVRDAEHFRELQAKALEGVLADRGVPADELPAIGMALLMAAISRALVMEDTLGVQGGHAELLAFIERHLERLEAGFRPPAAEA